MAELYEDRRDFHEEYFDAVDEINRRWKRGKHKMRNGKCISIKDMQTSHLQNCIRMWGDDDEYDLTPFRKELKKRSKTTGGRWMI